MRKMRNSLSSLKVTSKDAKATRKRVSKNKRLRGRSQKSSRSKLLRGKRKKC